MAPSTKEIERPADHRADEAAPAVAVSVVVPVAERCDDLEEIYLSHAGVLSKGDRPFEFVFVIDGGFVDAARKLEPLVALGEPIRIVLLPRSCGEATALAVGFEHARGQVLITIPAYFQTAPEEVLRLLSLLDEGHDLVVARRWPRVDPWLNRIQNYGFHVFTRWLTGVEIHDLGCGLRALRKRVATELLLYGDLHRFLPLLAYQRGFRVVETSVRQHERNSGLRLYRPGTYLRRLLDILTLVFLFKFTKKPLRFFGLIGTALFGVGLCLTSILAMQRIFNATALSDRPLLLLGVLLMVLGIQTGSIGLLGEMIIFTHARKMKDYAVGKFLR